MLLFLGASALLLAFPGPAVIFLVTRSAEHGRAAGLVSLLGVETATLIYALAAAAGLAGVIAASASAFAAVRYAGAAYLLYLGVQRLRGRAAAPAHAVGARSRLYASGLAVQLLNPKIAVFFVAFLPQFVPRHGSPALAMLALGCIFTLLALLSDGLYVLLGAGLGARLRASVRARRALDRGAGVVYAALGLGAALAGAGPRHAGHR